MSKLNAQIITDESIALVVNNQPYTMSRSNPSAKEVLARLSTGKIDGIEALFDTGEAVGVFTKGNIVVQNGVVLYKGAEVANHVTDRILDFLNEGLPYQPLINFLDKLLANPSKRAVDELYKFLEHKNMPLTPDGNFLAYKSVRSNLTDHYTGKFTNTVGAMLEMPRNTVDDNKEVGCSYGFHVGSLEYVTGFGGNDKVLLIVEVNPADVVSVPSDCNCQKLRTCKYKVVGTFEQALTAPLVSKYSPEAEATLQDEIEIEAEEADFESYLDDSYDEGYQAGEDDANNTEGSDVSAALDNAGDVDEDAFIEGYNKGYEDYSEPSPKEIGVGAKTRSKLRKAAKAQKRDASGRFV